MYHTLDDTPLHGFILDDIFVVDDRFTHCDQVADGEPTFASGDAGEPDSEPTLASGGAMELDGEPVFDCSHGRGAPVRLRGQGAADEFERKHARRQLLSAGVNMKTLGTQKYAY